MNNNIINAAIQLVPIAERNTAFPIIDNAISVIQQSGLPYEVGGFETNVEGTFDQVMQLFNEVCKVSVLSGNECLVYLKLHIHPTENLSSELKLEKFRK
jgi:uncharacterized protein YqgV (UPF0045/DUF77 family)